MVQKILMWWCCHFYNIFTLCLPNEIRRTERGIYFRLSRLLHNCLIREQHHSGPSELSLLADHPEPSDDWQSTQCSHARQTPTCLHAIPHFLRSWQYFSTNRKNFYCKFDWRLHSEKVCVCIHFESFFFYVLLWPKLAVAWKKAGEKKIISGFFSNCHAMKLSWT